MVYAFALLVLQGGPIELAALAPYAPAIATTIASAVTGTATLLATRRTGRGSREASTIAKKHEAIEAINAALSDVSRSFDEWLNPLTERATARTAGERVDRALKKLGRTWDTHLYLFPRTKTTEIVGMTIDMFAHQYREVSGVMLVGRARSPHYDKALRDARDWLDQYKERWQVELNNCFSRETGSVSTRAPLSSSRVARMIRGWRTRRFRSRLLREMIPAKHSQEVQEGRSQESRSRLELESGYSAKGGHHNG
jgi:hypothetical protein